MATVDPVVRRNIELEIENCFLKEQKVQDQRGIQFVFNSLAAQQAQIHHGTHTSCDARIRELEAENIMLRQNVARLTSDEAPDSSRSDWKLRGEQDLVPQQCSHIGLGEWRQHGGHARQNLVDVENYDLRHYPLTPKPASTGLDLEISLPGPPQSSTLPVIRDLLSDKDSPKIPNEDVEEWQAMKAPTSPEQEIIFDRPFYQWEHSKLVGMATFLERMERDEYENYFDMRATNDKRHSAEEWRKYYEAVVRPKHLAIHGGVTRSIPEKSTDEKVTANAQVRTNDGIMQQFNGRSLEDVKESSKEDEKLMPNTDEAEVVATAEGLEVDDLLQFPQAKGMPQVTEAATHAQREPSTRGRSKGRSRGRRRGRNSSAAVLYEHGSTNPSLFRTVMVTNVPATVSLATVVNQIRGGKIVHAKYAETAGMKTKPPITTNTVIIDFLEAKSAAAFVEYTKQQVSAEGMTAKLMPSASSRLRDKLLRDIRDGVTRVLFIVDKNAQWEPEEVIERLQCHVPELATPLSAGRNESGVLYFQFAGIRHAREAWSIVHGDRCFFGEVSKGFWPDPCERPRPTENNSAEGGGDDEDE